MKTTCEVLADDSVLRGCHVKMEMFSRVVVDLCTVPWDINL